MSDDLTTGLVIVQIVDLAMDLGYVVLGLAARWFA